MVLSFQDPGESFAKNPYPIAHAPVLFEGFLFRFGALRYLAAAGIARAKK